MVTPGAENTGGSPWGAGRERAGWGEASTEMMGRAEWFDRLELAELSRRGGAAATPSQTVPVKMTRRLFTESNFDLPHE